MISTSEREIYQLNLWEMEPSGDLIRIEQNSMNPDFLFEGEDKVVEVTPSRPSI